MNGIGWAVKQLQDGRRVARSNWNGRGMWLELQRPDVNSKMTLPYVYLNTALGDRIPWVCSQSDLLSFDWEIV